MFGRILHSLFGSRIELVMHQTMADEENNEHDLHILYSLLSSG